MAINFPSSPATDDTYTVGNITYTWDGTSWSSTSIAPPKAKTLTVSASRTLVLTDVGAFLKCTSAGATTITVPPNSSVVFALDIEISITQYGAGTVTIAEGSGVTINSLGDALDIAGQYAAATLKKIGTDEWLLVGALA